MKNVSAPMRRKTEGDQKSQAGNALRQRILAPTLEHSNQSNEE